MADGIGGSAMMALQSSTLAGVSAAGAAAAAGASRSQYRRAQNVYHQTSNLNTASYMSNLRAPVYPPRSPGAGGVGLHIHYQGRCPHHDIHGPSYQDKAYSSQSERGYPYPRDYRSGRSTPYTSEPRSECGCAQCYWTDFLQDDIKKYKKARAQLRETYLWNLHELVRRHAYFTSTPTSTSNPISTSTSSQSSQTRPQQTKSRSEKEVELEKLYRYYVSRVREVYDNHCRHHRLLFREPCIRWEAPEKATLREEDAVGIAAKEERGAGGDRAGVGVGGEAEEASGGLATTTNSPSTRAVTPTMRSHRSSGSSKVFMASLRGTVSRNASGSRWDIDPSSAIHMNKGKEKENVLDPGGVVDENGDVNSQVENDIDDDIVGDIDSGEGRGKDIETSTSLFGDNTVSLEPEPLPESDAKHKPTMHQRLRSFWLSRIAREKSAENQEPGQEGGKEKDGNEDKVEIEPQTEV